MTPGLGLAENIIIDQHFSERGRIRRLLGAVAENPRMLGIGVDEDTAVVVESDGTFHTVGSGAVYVVDGHDLSYTNISEVSFNRALSVFGVKLHTLSSGDSFNIHSRHPAQARADVEVLDAESQLMKGAAPSEQHYDYQSPNQIIRGKQESQDPARTGPYARRQRTRRTHRPIPEDPRGKNRADA